MKIRLSLLLLVSGVGFAGIANGGGLRVAVAANFSSALERLAPRFEAITQQHIVIIRGSTGKLYAQIKQGAPYDVFLAADVERPRRLEQEQLTIKGSRYTYAIGQLALWRSRPAANKDSHSEAAQTIRDDLLHGRFRQLAIANPRTAPYGQAAVELMRNLAIYKQCLPKLVYGENVAQAYQFVQSGNADLGFVALSYVKSHDRQYWIPPSSAYNQLNQQLVILKRSKQLGLAKQFVEFMRRTDTRAMIRALGYSTP